MQEFEAKFSRIDVKALRAALVACGYTQTLPETLMKRKVLHIEGNSYKWARVRDEGNKITATIKEVTKENDIDGVQEAEVVVNDFDHAVRLLEMAGFYVSSYQETKREAWQKDDVEVVIDHWPGLAPMAEVEAPSAAKVEKACMALGFDMSAALYGGIGVVYEKELGLSHEALNNLPQITFSNPPQAQA